MPAVVIIRGVLFYNRNMMRKPLLGLFSISAYFVAVTVAREAIVGGKRASFSEFRYQVSVQVDGFGHVCGGGIIEEQFILTAAHCIFVNDRIDNTPLTIIAGTDDLKHIHPPTLTANPLRWLQGRNVKPQRTAVRKIFVPKEYNPQDIFSTGDIAVLMLDHGLGLSHEHTNLKKIELAKYKHENYARETGTIAGFGWQWVNTHFESTITLQGGNYNKQLQYTKADIFKECPLPEFSEKLLCARIKHDHNDDKPRGVCVGDSGGPLVHRDTVVGVLIIGPKDCVEKDNHTGVYTRVSHYLEFIEHALNNQSTPDMRTLELIP